MTDAQIWLIAAIVLFILEIVTPGFVLANVAVASLCAAGAAWLGWSVPAQVIVFAVACVVSFVTLRPLLKRTLQKGGKGQATGIEALIGRQTKVMERIPTAPDTGRVQVDGDSWRASSVDEQPIEQGTMVRVVRVESTTLIVQRV